MRLRTLCELALHDHAELTRLVTEGEIAAFAAAIGDRNPLHRDRAYAARTPFATPIAPGIFTAGLVSAVIGTTLPGPGSVYLSQTLKFTRPVRAGDTLTARVEIVEILKERSRVRLQTTCVNQRGENVLAGEAWVLVPRATEPHAGRPEAALPAAA